MLVSFPSSLPSLFPSVGKYYWVSTIAGAGGKVVTKTDIAPVFMELTF